MIKINSENDKCHREKHCMVRDWSDGHGGEGQIIRKWNFRKRYE